MKDQENDITWQKLKDITFSFTLFNSKPLIYAQTQSLTYITLFQPHHELSVNNLITALESKDFQVLERGSQKLLIQINKTLQIQFLESQQIFVPNLMKRIDILKSNLDQQTDKNSKLQLQNKNLNKQVQEQKAIIQSLLQQIQKNHESLPYHSQEFHNAKNKPIKSEKIIQKPNQRLDIYILQHKLYQASKVINQLEDTFYLKQFLQPQKITTAQLLYRATDNEFCTKKFHQKCDGVPNTLTVVLTQFNKKIGAYTPLIWKSPNKEQWGLDHTNESFIFSLTHNEKFILKSQRAILRSSIHGPVFGEGYDIIIYDKANSHKKSWANICESYVNKKYKKGEKSSWERFHGNPNNNSHFKVKEWEVWGLKFE